MVKLNSDALTNLTNAPASDTLDINSSTGTNTTLPAATTSLAGMMTGSDKTKLDGLVTPSIFKATKTSSQSTNDQTTTEMQNYTSTEIDTAGNFNLTTGRYTIGTSGWYKVSGTISYQHNTTGDRSFFVYIDAVLHKYYVKMPAVTTTNMTSTLSLSTLLEMSAASTVSLGADQSSGGSLDVVDCEFTVEFVM